ncbi:uncharacterized protein HD556DRAFT_1441401 [Suillus plorans]|uniref:DUF6830 domain-containing protein n=1 Tax=Suillus plorans TaxID=116603 RepID=A0A9P7AXT4_9AGAM|nr:uncharacterized protein HD556DRAFT_1441401 [Suillus plorans]KAG1796716.1 hypothetical protein HD556DRAFT_1441401 [Suillus plorans]
MDDDLDIIGPGINEADPYAVADDFWGPKHTVTNFFKKAQQVSSDTEAAKPLHTFLVGPSIAVHLNFDASIQHILVNIVAEQFSLPDLRGALADYVEVWFKVRIQQAAYHGQSTPGPALMVNAFPPSATWKYGRYDAAIFAVDDTKLQQWPISGLKGHMVVEVHLIMQPLPPQRKSTIWAAHFLAYVQRLDVIPQRHGSSLEHTTHMHILKCAMRSARVPFGDILPLDQLCSFAHIVPRFGPAASDSRK